jgi:hypothetical protein
VDDASREISERDQSSAPLDMIAGRRIAGDAGQGGAHGGPPGGEDPPPLPIAVTLSWGLF